MDLLESVWEYREQTLYPSLFGQAAEEIFVLDANEFATFGAEADPRWLFLGVMVFAPTATRDSWLYVTSGGTTPWEIDDDATAEDPSWISTELVIEASQRADWPIRALQRLLAYNVLLAHGHFGDVAPLCVGARGPLSSGDDSLLRYVVIAQPSHYAAQAQLESGTLAFLQVVGITESERDYAKAHSSAALIERLTQAGACPVIDPKRQAVL